MSRFHDRLPQRCSILNCQCSTFSTFCLKMQRWKMLTGSIFNASQNSSLHWHKRKLISRPASLQLLILAHLQKKIWLPSSAKWVKLKSNKTISYSYYVLGKNGCNYMHKVIKKEPTFHYFVFPLRCLSTCTCVKSGDWFESYILSI